MQNNNNKVPEAVIMTITPELALGWLVDNTMNRPVTARLVERIADEITDGKWRLNGDSIRFAKKDEKGVEAILDGQHRLMAIERAGKPVQSFVIRGLDKECFTTINTNCRPRGTSDVLGIAGEQNVTMLASAMQWVCRYEKEWLAAKKNFSVADVQDILKIHPEIRKSISDIVNLKCRLLPPSIAAFLHYIFQKHDPELAEVFIHGLIGGYDPDKYPAFSLLHQRLIRDFTSKVGVEKADLVVFCIKAWNATRTGKQIKVLSFSANEVAPKPC